MANVSAVTVFFLSGLNESLSHRIVLFCLSLTCYCLIFLVNGSIILTVASDSSLHEPMYILLCVFCANGLYGTTGFYPKFLWDLLSAVQLIPYAGCLAQAQVMHSYASSDLAVLALMAFDRYVAICRPLEYRAIMSKQRLVRLVAVSWLLPFCVVAVNIILTTRLQLCSVKFPRFFCVNWLIVTLACSPAKTTINSIVAYMSILFFLFYGVLIVLSYVYVIRTCVVATENRAKFVQTCVPHLFCVSIFVVTVLTDFMNMRFGRADIPQALKNFVAMEYLVFSPILNPLIYGFKLTKIRSRIIRVVTFRRKDFRPSQ